jgi:hypothetical protein
MVGTPTTPCTGRLVQAHATGAMLGLRMLCTRGYTTHCSWRRFRSLPFWLVLPTLPMFLVIPAMLRASWSFAASLLGAHCLRSAATAS